MHTHIYMFAGMHNALSLSPPPAFLFLSLSFSLSLFLSLSLSLSLARSHFYSSDTIALKITAFVFVCMYLRRYNPSKVCVVCVRVCV